MIIALSRIVSNGRSISKPPVPRLALFSLTASLTISCIAIFYSPLSAQEKYPACETSKHIARDGSFSPDGKTIAFVSSRSGNSEVFTMRPDGSEVRRLISLPGNEYYPSFSPDGKTIVFDSHLPRTGNRRVAAIYTIDSNGKNLKRITPRDGFNVDPSFAPDGKKIVFYSERDGHSQIYEMNVDGTGERRLTNTKSREYTPVYSPDGKRILFISTRDGNAELYVMDRNGSNQRRLTNSPLSDRVAHWSPDGKKAIFYSRKSGVSSAESWSSAEIETVNSDGSGRVKITRDIYADQGPVYSPDGKKILFTSCRSGHREVYIMDNDGKNIKRLTYSQPKSK